ncbi:MOB kinase activator 2-like [Protopterus annectens]|uniref:MOB kinase activator 2-like n=1 Tax=Protopterus annectens TaxID=7888 RepID=UPI001CFBE505|nr:MOB kinase activator 2-like [Protopterus annectens]XP_043944592.1 MOB kinase activator 2-like [Protopterus annectens]
MGGCQSAEPSSAEEAAYRNPAFEDVEEKQLKNVNSKSKKPVVDAKLNIHPTPPLNHKNSQLGFKDLVSLPPGIDQAEWLATNTIAFFKMVNVFYGAMSEFCTARSCPTASAPGDRHYTWLDDNGKKVKCTAPLYFDYVTSYIQDLLTDENVFPTKKGCKFPNGFIFLIQKIFLLLLHVFAHLYWAHYHQVLDMEMHTHLHTLLTHFMTFSREFKLLEPQDTSALEKLIAELPKP